MKLFKVASLSVLVGGSAMAQGTAVTHTISGPANTEIRAGWFAESKGGCTTSNPPEARVVDGASNGVVKLRQAKVRAKTVCASSDVPAVLVFYQSKENYRGKDSFTVQIGNKGLHKFNVDVAGMLQ